MLPPSMLYIKSSLTHLNLLFDSSDPRDDVVYTQPSRGGMAGGGGGEAEGCTGDWGVRGVACAH